MNQALAKTLNTSTQFATVLSQILRVHIPIVDNYQSETAAMQPQINFDMSEVGCIVEDAFKSGKIQVMTERLGHPACKRCPDNATCQECFEIWAPIKVYDDVIGVVGFVCFSEAQRQGIMQNYKAYVVFLEQIAGLIALEAIEANEREKREATTALLESILEQIETGVIVLNTHDNLLRINKKGRRLLGEFGQVADTQKIGIEPTGKQFYGMPEYRMALGNSEYHLIGKMYEINATPYSKVFLFNDASSLEANALGLGNGKPPAINKVVGVSDEINAVKRRIMLIAPSSSSIIITGETGLDKGLYAEAIHDESDRAGQPFITLNCTAVPESALDAELFGSERTRAGGGKGKPGKFEMANNGTLYINDIHALPLSLQRKLLNVLEGNENGINQSGAIDVRIVSSTTENIEELTERGAFLRELFYSIGVIPLDIPPLQARKEDIRVLAAQYLNQFSERLNKNITHIDEQFWTVLENYDWPGNVRELQNAMEYAVNMLTYPGVVTIDLLEGKINRVAKNVLPKDLNLERMERDVIERVLHAYGDTSKEDIAKMLGIGVATLYRKMKKYGWV